MVGRVASSPNKSFLILSEAQRGWWFLIAASNFVHNWPLTLKLTLDLDVHTVEPLNVDTLKSGHLSNQDTFYRSQWCPHFEVPLHITTPNSQLCAYVLMYNSWAFWHLNARSESKTQNSEVLRVSYQTIIMIMKFCGAYWAWEVWKLVATKLYHAPMHCITVLDSSIHFDTCAYNSIMLWHL